MQLLCMQMDSQSVRLTSITTQKEELNRRVKVIQFPSRALHLISAFE